MNTVPNYRVELEKLVEKLDSTDMQLLIAFAAGYEAGKIGHIPEPQANTQEQQHLDSNPSST